MSKPDPASRFVWAPGDVVIVKRAGKRLTAEQLREQERRKKNVETPPQKSKPRGKTIEVERP